MAGTTLRDFPVHLGLGATAVAQPLFTGSMDWYADYSQRHAADGVEGRLVSMHTFAQPWDVWEVHPHGSELVVCLAGSLTLYQELPDGTASVTTLDPGQYAINEPGVWHTADVQGETTALFVTAGAETRTRRR